MLNKLFLATLALPVLLSAPAFALRTSATYTVRFDGDRVGTWKLRNKVSETSSSCRYTVQWKDLAGPPLSRTRLCVIDESKAGDNFDCEVARRTFFDTLIRKGPGTCRGFDDFGQETTIRQLIAGEDSDGEINGVVMGASVGDVQNLQVTP